MQPRCNSAIHLCHDNNSNRLISIEKQPTFNNDKVFRHDVTKVGDFYNGVLWKKILFFLSNSTEIPFLITQKTSTHKFQLEIRSNKKVIGQKRLTNLWVKSEKMKLFHYVTLIIICSAQSLNFCYQVKYFMTIVIDAKFYNNSLAG